MHFKLNDYEITIIKCKPKHPSLNNLIISPTNIWKKKEKKQRHGQTIEQERPHTSTKKENSPYIPNLEVEWQQLHHWVYFPIEDPIKV